VTRNARIVPAVLTVLVVAFLGAGLWALVDRRDDVATRTDPATAAVVAELEAFVESARGLRFLEPVQVSVLSDAAFRRKLAGGDPLSKADAAVQAGVLRALGLLGQGEDLGDATGLDPETVAGFYDTDTKELVVRGGRLSPFVRQVLVHELTHALDDQHFGLDRQTADDDAALALDALVEGDAVLLEERYVASLSAAERRAARDEEDATFGGPDVGQAPDPLADLADFPYRDGPDLVAALLDAGGTARLDAAFRSPPTTSAEVLHPERFLAGRGPAGVAPVEAAGRTVDEGVLGEAVVRLVLARSMPDDEAGRAAAGWAGDRYVAWRTGRRTCVRDTVVLDSVGDARELATALRTWAGDHPGADIRAPGDTTSLTLTRCA
jgi:hypothetical protein